MVVSARQLVGFTSVLLAGLSLIAASLVSVGQNGSESNAVDGQSSVLHCIDRVLADLTPQEKDIVKRTQAAELCYRTMHGIGLLRDFDIRRSKFLQQKYDEVVLLWMVVIITLSGVSLAGLQLAVSYRLASVSGNPVIDSPTEIILERTRIVVRSSVTGLAILVISFAFFLVFVLEIYTLREIRTDPLPSAAPIANPPAGYGQAGPKT